MNLTAAIDHAMTRTARLESVISAFHQDQQRQQRELDRAHNVITSLQELSGWDIIGLERWKPGVVRYTAERSLGQKRERKMGFAQDAVFAAVQLPP